MRLWYALTLRLHMSYSKHRRPAANLRNNAIHCIHCIHYIPYPRTHGLMSTSPSLPPQQVDGEEVAVAAGFAEAAAKLPALSPEALVILVDEAGEQGAAAGAALLAYKEFAPKKVRLVLYCHEHGSAVGSTCSTGPATIAR